MTLEDLYRLLRAGHVQAQGIVDTIDRPLVVLDANLCVVNVNPAFLQTFRVNREDTMGECLIELGNGQWNIPRLKHLLEEVIPHSSAVLDYEVSHDFPSLGRRTMLVTARRLIHPDNNSPLMLVVFEDVTERRQTDVSRDLVLSETEHRLKNFLALVGALARQIPAEGEGARHYREAFLSRLEVLTGAELGLFSRRGNDFGALVPALLAPYREKIRLEEGPPFPLSREQVRSLSMILHEMATNSLKYGALSIPSGHVRIGWSITKEGPHHATIDWQEENGPPVSAPGPDGFGTRLIKSLVQMDLNGSLETHYEPKGLKVRIEVPLKQPEA